MTNKQKFKKILILGSGALKIGQAGEFDYSGSQAIKALKEEGIQTVLINPNIATIQTSKVLANEVYFLPVTPFFVEKVIEKEKPDGILLSFGGQTALNCGIALHENNILKKHNVEILGTPISAVILTEDREEFAQHLRKINIPTPISKIATTLEQAKADAEDIGYPVMIRAGYALGGQGSGIAKDEAALEKIVTNALAFAPQVLIEQYLHHFKEIEYEVVRDKYDNCITVCNMENFDPLGIHTGDSVVIAPSQTLTNFEFHSLREASIKIVRSLGIVGECNVQFALNPNPKKKTTVDKQEGALQPGLDDQILDYYVIEVNARLSRSSALASKATGYPLAYVAAKLGLGYGLTELKNKVTGVTQACFEPSLDYCVVKIPRWDLEKFKGADETIGTSMKSVGEVMGIGRTFEEAYQKAIRMLDLDFEGATSERIFEDRGKVKKYLEVPTPKRMFAIAASLKEGMSVEAIHATTGVDNWFLNRVKNIVDHEKQLEQTKDISPKFLLELKQIGFSDKRIGEFVGKTGLEIRALRKKLGIVPSIFQIDTLSAEFPAKTNYLYMTYNGHHDDVKPLKHEGVVVLGSGPYRIGSSVEFDWTSVSTVQALKKHNKKSIIINCNPETVSTDYDVSDRLYFEELTFERIADVAEFEESSGLIISVGGQTPNNRAQALQNYGLKILGTNPINIDQAEDRNKFSKLLDELEIKQPEWNSFSTFEELQSFADRVGYPVLVRPSYVLSGSAMNVCYSEEDMKLFVKQAATISPEYPVTVSKFYEKVKELEFDAVAQNGKIKAFVIAEHIENAGVHSGDATIVLPPQNVYVETMRKIEEIGHKIAKALEITGPFNMQLLAKDNEVFVIEVNLRASRTFPFISKVMDVDFMELFVDCLFEKAVKAIQMPQRNFVAVKAPQFSFARLSGADPLLRVEMASTGEVACFGEDVEEAYMKSILATGGSIPNKGIMVSLGSGDKKEKFLESARLLKELHIPIYATEGTAIFLKEHGIETIMLHKIHEQKEPNVITYVQEGKIDLVINVVDQYKKQEIEDSFAMRRFFVDNNIQLFTKLKQARLFVKALIDKDLNTLPIKAWSDYK